MNPSLRVLLSVTALAAASRVFAAAAPVELHWLGDTPAPATTGVSWGVPWPKGAVPKDQQFSLATADGKTLPLQTWPMAYWPDGSLKWSGFATVAGLEQKGTFRLSAGASGAAQGGTLTLQQNGNTIEIDTGKLKARIAKSGANLIESLSVDGREVARDGHLISVLQTGPETDYDAAPPREKFASHVTNVTVEQSGPVRAVVKIEGKHRGAKSGREWLPFTVRLYFYAGQETVRMVHTFVFDGDQHKDFIRGLGVAFAVPMREKSWNRHVRFSGMDGGLWSEPIQPGGGYPAQQAGQRVEPAQPGQGGFGGFGGGNTVPRTVLPDPEQQQPIWSDFKLTQPTPDGFTIHKRTNPESTWLFANAGRRASGLAFVGDVTGGLAISLKDFWQSYPSGLEIHGAEKDAAELIAWLWSPDAPAMDMRHYATRAYGLNATYEDVQEGNSTPYGVARTSELTVFATPGVPSKADTVAMAKAGAALPLIASTPAYIHSTGVFGVWSLPDRSTPLKVSVEDRLDATMKFYEGQVDERRWYGFWTYGDFIHSYSAAAHQWYYDWGGHAWQNTELGEPLWVWYMFLRTGRADHFRLAEALARNTSETNVYHIGPMAGLGSRHNVVKWGDGAKEARVSQAAHWRPYYYITTDERAGDVMREQLKSDFTAIRFDPMRLAQPPLPQDPKYPGRVRIGPDWLAFAGNWMAEWERTGDTKWRDKIITGVESIHAMKYWMKSGVFNGMNPDIPKDANGNAVMGPLKGGGSMTVGYDPETGKLSPIPDPIAHEQVPVNYNLFTIQGGAEVMFELVPLLGREDLAKMWLQYSRLSVAPADVLLKDKETGAEGGDARYVERSQGGPRLAAYAYAHTKNKAFAERAIESLAGRFGRTAVNPTLINGPEQLNPVHEALGMSTNEAAQSSLTMIEILELCADALPNELPAVAQPEFPGRGRGGRGRGGPQNPNSPSPATNK